MVKILFTKGSSLSLPAHGWVGARATILSFSVSVPPSARQKFWPSNQAGEKEGGWGEGIFARLFSDSLNKQSLFPIFSIPPEAELKASFLIPRFCASGAMAKGDKIINLMGQTI